MWPLQHWLKPRVPSHAWHHGRLRVKVDQACVAALAPWRDHQWMEQGVPLDTVCRRKVVSTDASNSGWGALCDGKPAFSHWSRKKVAFTSTAWKCWRAVSPRKRLFILVERLLEWAQLNLHSLRATHVLGRLNQGADMLSRSNVPSEEWMLHPQMVQRIWEIFGKAEVDFFASENNYHCPTYFLKNKDALAHEWPILLLYTFPPVALIPQIIRQVRDQKHKVLLVGPLLEEPTLICRFEEASGHEAEPTRLEALPRSGPGLVACLLQKFVRRPAGSRRPHLPDFIVWMSRPYRPGSSLLKLDLF
ncbi:hypothetical protein H4Q32_028267 [Labeo rohita]|uniref:Uncharacterized protein n=1 Tax=Labeo rohita TaxID=84645 RepID=A0ABQ8L3M6_LABRO|nr:hypothetical protein H4Q32_028267 [Labeo rohita]